MSGKLEVIAKWLYRRYKPSKNKPTWELLGGTERHSWMSDAQGILDAIFDVKVVHYDIHVDPK